MYFKVDVFPNYEDEDETVVGFSVHFASDEENEPLLNEFEVDIKGYIPVSDSVAQLKRVAEEKAWDILNHLLETS